MPGTEEKNIHCDARMAHLTRREQDVMAYLLRGAANKVIAAELGISQRTVESHRARLFRKMRVRNIVGLVSMMYASGGPRHCVAEASADAYRKKRPRGA